MKRMVESREPKREAAGRRPTRCFAQAFAAVEAVIARAVASGKYPPGDTWRERPIEEHLGHAVEHLRKLGCGDSSEPHLEHAATRILMALENELCLRLVGRANAGGGGGRRWRAN